MTENPQPSSTQINTGGGAYIEGSVNTSGGDFIGRDKVIVQHLDATDIPNQRNHATMRHRVRAFWVDGVLKHSLYNEILLRLNLKQQPNAADNQPWDLILQQPGALDSILPQGVHIIDVFDQMANRLLILGEPGSGKTTMLLELTDALLERADSDPIHPTPVIFNLSSWAEKRASLSDWLIEELRAKYIIPKAVAQRWIANDDLLLLLDGVDEVQQEHRDTCVTAINHFLQEHMVWTAICSRATEYESLSTRLKLQGAVKVQPLTLQQIDGYLNTAGSELSSVRTALQRDAELQELATSPLLLSIITVAYYGVSDAELAIGNSSQKHQRHLFDAYIQRMFMHRNLPQLYTVQQSLREVRETHNQCFIFRSVLVVSWWII